MLITLQYSAIMIYRQVQKAFISTAQRPAIIDNGYGTIMAYNMIKGTRTNAIMPMGYSRQ